MGNVFLYISLLSLAASALSSTDTMIMAIKILIINPNSTTSMTLAFKPLLTPITPLDVTFSYFTAPPQSPPSIDDATTAQLSAEVSLPHLITHLPHHDAFVIACYSEHPLIPLLKAETTKPIIGIFEASITASLYLLRGEERFGIVTTGKLWEELLTVGVGRFLGVKNGGERFAGVESTGLSAVELHKVGSGEAGRRIKDAAVRLVRKGGVGVVCLGCAGMAGVGDVVRRAVEGEGKKVVVIDGVVAAVGEVVGMVRCGFTGES